MLTIPSSDQNCVPISLLVAISFLFFVLIPKFDSFAAPRTLLLCTNVFRCFSFVHFEIIQTQNSRSNSIQKTSLLSFKTQIKIFAYFGLAKSGFGQGNGLLAPGAPLLYLARSIYKVN